MLKEEITYMGKTIFRIHILDFKTHKTQIIADGKTWGVWKVYDRRIV